MISGENIIGHSISRLNSTSFKTFNPLLNKENSWEIYEATIEEIENALDLAHQAFTEFAQISDQERSDFLKQIAAEIMDLGEELIEVYCQESGLPVARARVERARTIQQINVYADLILTKNWRKPVIDKADPNRAPNPKPDLRKTLRPLGPIVVFGASNFPLAYSTAGGDTASALAAGCPVIVKSHPMHAGTGELVARAIQKASVKCNMPEGTFSNLNSSGIEVGVQLVNDDRVKGVGFTGSIRGGRALMDLASSRKNPIPVFAEMGSVNPVFISQQSIQDNPEHWVEMYAHSITNGTGQFCTNPGILIALNNSDTDSFASELADALSAKQSTVMLHPNIAEAFEINRRSKIDSAQVSVVHETVDVQPNFARQTLASMSAHDFLQNPNLQEEVFGPFSLLIKCEHVKEAEKVIKSIHGQLTGTVILTKDEYKSHASIVSALEGRVGRIIFNGVPTGVEVSSAMQHGGPYPSSSDSRFTAVGDDAIYRWLRPIAYQNFPVELLPDSLK